MGLQVLSEGTRHGNGRPAAAGTRLRTAFHDFENQVRVRGVIASAIFSLPTALPAAVAKVRAREELQRDGTGRDGTARTGQGIGSGAVKEGRQDGVRAGHCQGRVSSVLYVCLVPLPSWIHQALSAPLARHSIPSVIVLTDSSRCLACYANPLMAHGMVSRVTRFSRALWPSRRLIAPLARQVYALLAARTPVSPSLQSCV